jgi:hypothetical protein
MSFRMSSPSTSKLSAQMDEVFFLFSLRSKYVAASGRTVSYALQGHHMLAGGNAPGGRLTRKLTDPEGVV